MISFHDCFIIAITFDYCHFWLFLSYFFINSLMEVTLTIYNQFNKYSTSYKYKYYVSINSTDINLPKSVYKPEFETHQHSISFKFAFAQKFNIVQLITDYIYALSNQPNFEVYYTTKDDVKKIKAFDIKTADLLINCPENDDSIFLNKFLELYKPLILRGKITVYDIYEREHYTSNYRFSRVDDINDCIQDIKHDFDDFMN